MQVDKNIVFFRLYKYPSDLQHSSIKSSVTSPRDTNDHIYEAEMVQLEQKLGDAL